MAGETAGGAPEQQTDSRTSEDELLLHAVTVLRRRYEEGSRFAELPAFAASELGDTLAALATAQPTPGETDREEAIALAHRLIDDDHPELSPMWPNSETQ